jgi:diguanylate cyclase (GGDEF)-like protein
MEASQTSDGRARTGFDGALAQIARLTRGRLAAEEEARDAREEQAALAMRLEEATEARDAAVREAQADIRQRRQRLGQVRKLARTDALTGLPNRRSADEELPRELARARRHEAPVCAVMLDLDHFKKFNDAMGHQAGDRLLKDTADAWRGTLRDTDYVAFYGFVARYGGEEFVVVLPDCDLEQALSVVKRLRASMPGGLTSSAGVACWDRAESAEGLIARADAALYRAKHAGRDRAVAA